MAKSQSNLLLGLALVLLGALFLLIQLDFFQWTPIWPLFVIVCGLLLLLKFAFNHSNYGLLMPAILFLIIGTLFFYLEQTTYFHLNRLWPTFVLAPGIGFLFMFFFGPAANRFWIPALILIVLAVLFYIEFWHFLRYWPLILIIIGFYLIFRRKKPAQSM